MSDVTDEALLAARDAIAALDEFGCDAYSCVYLDDDNCSCAKIARAALEAALPLIVGVERERCAKIAEAVAGPRPINGAPGCIVSGAVADAGEALAAAIRADTGGGTAHSPTDPEKTE